MRHARPDPTPRRVDPPGYEDRTRETEPAQDDHPAADEAERGAPAEKKVSWVELFFDLVFVYAITRTSQLLQEGHGASGILRALVAFVPVYWVWVGTTMHANLHDPDTPRSRVGIFGVGACGLLMALALPDAFHETGWLLGAAYLAARLILLALVQGLPHRHAYLTFTVAALVTGPLMLAGGLVHGDARLALWALAAATDLMVPLLARRRLVDVPFNADHLVERYGTLILIALGETIVATASGAEHLDARHIGAVLTSFALVCALWWVYFTFGPDAMRAALEGSRAQIDLIRPVLSYGHLGLIAGIVGIAAAVEHAVAEPMQPLHTGTAALLLGGTALYLVTFAFTRWRLFHTIAVPRITAAAVILVFLVVQHRVDAVVTMLLLAAVIAVLDVVELRLLPRTLHARRP